MEEKKDNFEGKKIEKFHKFKGKFPKKLTIGAEMRRLERIRDEIFT